MSILPEAFYGLLIRFLILKDFVDFQVASNNLLLLNTVMCLVYY